MRFRYTLQRYTLQRYTLQHYALRRYALLITCVEQEMSEKNPVGIGVW